MGIEYQTQVSVKLDGKVVGHIKQSKGVKSGYYYLPKGQKESSVQESDILPTIDAVKRALER